MSIFGAIEAGGTKFVCGLGDARSGSVRTVTIPTRSPDETFGDVARFFGEAQREMPIAAIGIGSFGPVDLNAASPSFGQIRATPKPHWQGTDMVARVKAILAVPVAIDTDVNVAALAEARAATPPVADLAYVTVGTGIGVGLVAGGHMVHGTGHPEMGHILPRRHPAHDGFEGICPYHRDCLEGLASGPAVAAAWGMTSSQLPADHVFWDAESHYLAQLCASLILTLAPARIVLGGGVMKQERLFPLVREKAASLLAGYIDGAKSPEELAARIVPPASPEPPGLIGAYWLAGDALAASAGSNRIA